MTTVEHNNRYPRTRFNKLGFGARFSLTPNGTSFVKINERQYGILGTSRDNPTSALLLHNGPVFYFTPPLYISSNGATVFQPEPNPFSVGNDSLTPDPDLIEVDPPFFKNLSSYLLSGTIDKDTLVTSLAWTFPNLLLVSTSEFVRVHLDQVVLQRSATTRATPFGPTGDGPVNANVNQVSYSTLPADPEWTTLLTQSPDYTIVGSDPSVYPGPKTATDTPPVGTNHVFHYRLVCCLHTLLGSDPNQSILARYVLAWNVITVVAPFTLTVPTDGSLPRNITWTVPGGPELSSLSRLFLNSFAVTRSSTALATTSSGFTMPAADNVTQSADVSVDTNSFITGGGGEYFNLAGAGVVRLVKGTAANTIQVINSGMSGNASPGASIATGKAITKVTELTWAFDLTTLPNNYTLERRASISDPYVTISTLSNTFSQPFKDALPPSPTLYYRLTANMPASEGISTTYALPYTVQSIS